MQDQRQIPFFRPAITEEEIAEVTDSLRSGGKIWQSPRIKSWYSPRGSLRALFRQYRQYGYWKVRVIQKHKLPASVRHLVPFVFVMFLLIAVLTIPSFKILALATNIGLFDHIFLYISYLTGAVLVLYLFIISAASILTARKNGWKYLSILPAVFANYHLSYGLGFLEGVRDFIIFKSNAAKSKTQITRN